MHGYENNSLRTWLQQEQARSGKQGACPHTRDPLKLETLTPAAQLFALVLAIVQAVGHLDAVQTADNDFGAFANTPDYEVALQLGRELLTHLLNAKGSTIQEKIKSLRASGVLKEDELMGSEGQIRLLEHTLGLRTTDLNDFANYYKQWRINRSLLLQACMGYPKQNLLAVVEEILEKHPEWLNSGIGYDELPDDGRNPLPHETYGTPLMLAILYGNKPLVVFLLAQPNINVSAICIEQTALTLALALGFQDPWAHNNKEPQYDMVRQLIAAGAKVDQEIPVYTNADSTEKTPRTALLLTWLRERPRVAETLIDLGANFPHSQHLFEQYCAEQKNTWELGEMLARTASMTGLKLDWSFFEKYHIPEEAAKKARPHIESSQAHWQYIIKNNLRTACKKGDQKLVMEILQANNMDVNVDLQGSTLLQVAAAYGHLDFVRFLLSQGSDVSIASDENTVALHAVLRPWKNFKEVRYDIARLLIQADNGTELNRVRPGHGNFLATAWALGNKTAAEQLILLGADVDRAQNFVEAKASFEKWNNTPDEKKKAAITLLKLFGDDEITSDPISQVGQRMYNIVAQVERDYMWDNEEAWNPGGIPQQIALSRQYLQHLDDKPFPGALLLSWEQWGERYNQTFPNREQQGYGPCAMVVYKGSR